MGSRKGDEVANPGSPLTLVASHDSRASGASAGTDNKDVPTSNLPRSLTPASSDDRNPRDYPE